MFLFKKVKAGALQYVLVISVIVAIVIFSFISFLYLQKRLALKSSFNKETILNVNFGFDFLSKNNIANNSSRVFKFSDNSLEETSITKKQWGIYDVAMIASKINNESFKKIGLLGYNIPKREALYLKENNTPLAVVGNTKIVGKCYLPKRGVKRGNISGTSYNNSNLIYGTSVLSNSSLPVIKNKSSIENIFNSSFLNDSIQYFQLETDLLKTNSFQSKTLVYKSNGALNLREINLTGNIIIESTTRIKVASSAILTDVILIAPEIEVQDNITGNFQVFASKKIIVGKNCTLNYPSALILYNKKKTDDKDVQILIKGNSDIKGSVVFYTENKKRDFNPQVIISEKTNVTGEVYCNKNLESLGNVYGSVYTNNFITKQNGSTYINHLYHSEINSKKLPEQFCGLSFTNGNLKVAKWLH